MLITFFRSIILYILVIFSVRLMGKRQIGELQPSELVITILVSNIATLPLEDLNIPLITGIIPILSLVCFEVIMSWAALKSKSLRKVISGTPKIIIRDGVIDQQVLKDLRFSVDDLMSSLRGCNIFNISDVQFAIVETTGKLSVYERYSSRNVTNSDLDIKGSSINPPDIIVSDGVLVERGLKATGLGAGWLRKIMTEKGVKIEEVFLLTADSTGEYNLIKKDGRG